MKYGRIENGVVVEVIDKDPKGNYHPDIVWVQLPEDFHTTSEKIELLRLKTERNQLTKELESSLRAELTEKYTKIPKSLTSLLIEESETGEDRDGNNQIYGVDFKLLDPTPPLAILQTQEGWDTLPDISKSEYISTIDFLDSEVDMDNIISVLEFLERFTDTELNTIYAAARADTSEGIELSIFMDKIKVSQQIDLKNETLITGMMKLVTSKLLTKDRHDEILGRTLE